LQFLCEGSLPGSIGERKGVAVVTRLQSLSDAESDCVIPRGAREHFPIAPVHLHRDSPPRDAAQSQRSAPGRLAGDIDRRRDPHADEHAREHNNFARQRARRYWQLADSDDALPPHDAQSTPGGAPSGGAK
jgi:hypothetical protein